MLAELNSFAIFLQEYCILMESFVISKQVVERLEQLMSHFFIVWILQGLMGYNYSPSLRGWFGAM